MNPLPSFSTILHSNGIFDSQAMYPTGSGDKVRYDSKSYPHRLGTSIFSPLPAKMPQCHNLGFDLNSQSYSYGTSFDTADPGISIVCKDTLRIRNNTVLFLAPADDNDLPCGYSVSLGECIPDNRFYGTLSC